VGVDVSIALIISEVEDECVEIVGVTGNDALDRFTRDLIRMGAQHTVLKLVGRGLLLAEPVKSGPAGRGPENPPQP